MALPIFLTGFMGTGKSTLGRALAMRLPLRFVDLDEEIENRMGCTAAEAFSSGRTADFRSTEAAVLEDICLKHDIIVACGGGTPCFGSNMDMMLDSGLVVCLTASHERLMRRLEEAAGKRPLLNGLSGEELARRVQSLMDERNIHYNRAHATFDASFLESEAEVESTCANFISTFLADAKS